MGLVIVASAGFSVDVSAIQFFDNSSTVRRPVSRALKEMCMKRRATQLALLLIAGLIGGIAPAGAQDIQERTIRFGHLNNPDHPVSIGRKEIRGAGRGEERRQDDRQRVSVDAARQRDAAAVGAAGRYSGNVGSGADVAGRSRQGVWHPGLSIHRQHVSAGRCLGRWTGRERCCWPSCRKRDWSA